jgi:hypothetical protein
VIDQRRGRSVGVGFQDRRVAAEQQAVAVVHFTRLSLGRSVPVGFIPNLTRQDGSAASRWLAEQGL